MRLLTTKIWLAYPELDRYDDDVCKSYIKRAKRLQNAWKFWLISLLALPIAWASWVGLMFATASLTELRSFRSSPGFLQDIFVSVMASGIAWVPLGTQLILRDRWLHRCVRKQLVGVQCPPCGYSLIGLTINNPEAPSVHCPECGQVTLLSDLGLTEADIDPTLIGEAT